MLTDAKAISSSLALSGYPVDWDNATVIRIGITDDQQLNATKIKLFQQLNYSSTKKKFGTAYDYFIFFVNNSEDVLNISGICGVGNPLVNATCGQINITSLNLKNLAKTERYLNYNSKVVKMIVYVWQ